MSDATRRSCMFFLHLSACLGAFEVSLLTAWFLGCVYLNVDDVSCGWSIVGFCYFRIVGDLAYRSVMIIGWIILLERIELYIFGSVFLLELFPLIDIEERLIVGIVDV